MMPPGLRKRLAFGSGVGIEIAGPRGSESLRVTAARVRPSGARVRGTFVIEDFPHQPAGVWGTDYAAFLRKQGMKHVAAMVLLPRHDVIVRTLPLPGVARKDLAAAIQFQLEGLHPYNEDDVITGWSPLFNSSTVLVAIARRETIERYSSLFAESGVKIAGFTCSAAAVYPALRLFGATPPAAGVLACQATAESIECYGESPAHALLSAAFPNGSPDALERAASLSASELRIELPPEQEPQTLAGLLSQEFPLAYAAALTSACPRLSLSVNLLPEDQRQASSAMLWIPSAALAAILLLLTAGLVLLPGFENRQYSSVLQSEAAKVTPAANRAAQLDTEIDAVRRRTFLLDDFRRRPRADMDVLVEMTRILPPPTWLNLMEINDRQVAIAGESDQAAPLLRIVDASRFFEGSEFSVPPLRTPGGELFRIRTNRENVPQTVSQNGARP